MDEKNIRQLTFGVAFNHMFKILDLWGEIADDILYKNKHFSPEFFSNISTQYTTERRLYNPQKNHQLLLTSNNLIFTQTIETDFNKEYDLFKKRVIDYIVPKILTKYALVVRRLGTVYTCEWNDEQMKNFSAKYFNPVMKNIIDFRFSKKESTTKASIFSDNSDFINKIFTVGNVLDSLRGISYDFQMHFNPLREDVRDTIATYMDSSYSNFKEDIINGVGDK